MVGVPRVSDIITILGGACIVLGFYLIQPGLAVAAFGMGLLFVARSLTEAGS